MREYIRHPSNIPLEIKLAEHDAARHDHLNNVSVGGLSFNSREPVRMGSQIVIRIPVINRDVEVTGKVVWCNDHDGGFEVGVVFTDFAEAFRTRMVEQICHIEQYKNEVLLREQRRLSSEQAAAEWISKFASSFPALEPEK